MQMGAIIQKGRGFPTIHYKVRDYQYPIYVFLSSHNTVSKANESQRKGICGRNRSVGLVKEESDGIC